MRRAFAQPAIRTALYYLTIFLPPAAYSILAGPWFLQQGLNAEQIGLINAAPILLMITLNLFIGRLADRARDWRQVIVVCAVTSALFSVGLIWTQTFWPILIVWALTTMVHMAGVTVLDAAALRMSARNGADFGSLRAWGTFGYLCALVVTGYLALAYGTAAFLPLFIGLAAVRALVALGLPPFRAPNPAQAQTFGATKLRQVMRLWFVLPLLGTALIHATHAILNAFQSVIWQEQGIGLDVIGLLVAVGALSETAMFFLFGRFARLLRARTWILLAALVTILRWAAMTLEPGLGWLFALQALHGISYGMGFIATTLFVANWTSEDIAAEAQGFFVMLQQAMSVMALVGFGWLFVRTGLAAFWVAAGLAALAAVAIAVSLRLQPPAHPD